MKRNQIKHANFAVKTSSALNIFHLTISWPLVLVAYPFLSVLQQRFHLQICTSQHLYLSIFLAVRFILLAVLQVDDVYLLTKEVPALFKKYDQARRSGTCLQSQ